MISVVKTIKLRKTSMETRILTVKNRARVRATAGRSIATAIDLGGRFLERKKSETKRNGEKKFDEKSTSSHRGQSAESAQR